MDASKMITDKKKKFIKAEKATELLKKEPERVKRTVKEVREKMYGKGA